MQELVFIYEDGNSALKREEARRLTETLWYELPFLLGLLTRRGCETLKDRNRYNRWNLSF